MEIAAMVLGIIGLVLSFCGAFGWLGSILAIVAIILGAVGLKRKGEKKGFAKAGLILGIIALIMGIVSTIACGACIVFMEDEGISSIEDLMYEIF